MSFFQIFSKTFTGFSVYSTVGTKPKDAWKYFFELYLFLAFVVTVVSVIQISIGTAQSVAELRRSAPEFTASIKDGKLAVTNLTLPYRFRFAGAQILVDLEQPLETLVKDTEADFFITADKFVSRPVTYFGQARSLELNWKDFDDLTTTKEAMIARYEKQRLLWTAVFAVSFFILMFVVTALGRLIYALLLSVIAFVIRRFSKSPLAFAQILAVAMIALTVPEVIYTLLVFARVILAPLVFIIALVVFFIMALIKFKVPPPDPSPAATPPGAA